MKINMGAKVASTGHLSIKINGFPVWPRLGFYVADRKKLKIWLSSTHPVSVSAIQTQDTEPGYRTRLHQSWPRFIDAHQYLDPARLIDPRQYVSTVEHIDTHQYPSWAMKHIDSHKLKRSTDTQYRTSLYTQTP